MLLALAFWIATGLLGWVYAGYPLAILILARLHPLRIQPSESRPELTVVIAVHDEATQIADRIANVFDQETTGARIAEVLVASDGSSDATNEIVAAIASGESRLRLLSLARGGQTAAQHEAFKLARGTVVVLTDAETRYAPDCLLRLCDVFRDPRVGVATGRLEWRGEETTATTANEGLYWRYERRVRAAESVAGLLTAVTGALLAIRRDHYRTVPTTASMDHLLPLYVRELGGLVVYVPDAVATDRPISGIREQFRNRSRTATRGISANLSMVRRLDPVRHPDTALAIWSHKLLRWATPWLAGVAIASASILAATGARGYVVIPIGAIAVLLLALAGNVLAGQGRRPPRVLAFARAFLVVNLAFAGAWINVIVGRRIEEWHGAEWRTRS